MSHRNPVWTTPIPTASPRRVLATLDLTPPRRRWPVDLTMALVFLGGVVLGMALTVAWLHAYHY